MSKHQHENERDGTMRLDKWLWAARFFKTRSLASKHIELGRVSVNGIKTKTSKYIVVGDVVDLTLNSLPYKIKVLALNHQRRPAPEARLLYEEDAPTIAKREAQKALDQASRITAAYPDGRPTKRDRRQLDRVKRGDW
ncbi:RNA-binding S4 domain-containing protein [Kingella kingae]|uniref:RNA-binding S4 domain-containing protein n=1 Tax=Kingella kingae TaxID=504 RepID=UPI000ADA3A8E|nr:RNA-binding S4 domain-containing protein [Kingella kingae]MDK4526182.1 RNA-binding S4 domain-containing protein [Kingella kingae]MDK4532219.1 RNA-binding S4 domain-containing protein [Kingella kingae]MDK4624997.1 RNA-binding S4 domain-containing protein [Kingella kingae]MDK4660655.1 RNA-binding S4 domain-containing protein [Kingella kingae]MDK4668627.1 RNA-binding S4 domain-containing protein [Kingella kingae]